MIRREATIDHLAHLCRLPCTSTNSHDKFSCTADSLPAAVAIGVVVNVAVVSCEEKEHVDEGRLFIIT